ncbi:hypothetical protein FJZ33_00265 [Candidatus Poribacteria bacterium]|nr:hypothetical protein [Candidatus Poribacteria bacterium]
MVYKKVAYNTEAKFLAKEKQNSANFLEKYIIQTVFSIVCHNFCEINADFDAKTANFEVKHSIQYKLDASIVCHVLKWNMNWKKTEILSENVCRCS